MPNRQEALVVSQPAPFEITHDSADNISFFVNVTFPVAGEYLVQTLIDSTLFEERVLTVSDQQLIASEDEASEAVNLEGRLGTRFEGAPRPSFSWEFVLFDVVILRIRSTA